jgi:ABC-type Fe3+/spermidine/putrescine transport system ATPase subunit
MIRIEHLYFAVGSFALQDVSLHAKPGEYFVLLGPSGAGKTLLLECLCGLNRIRSGRVVLGETDVSDWEPRRRGVGYLPQDYALFPHKTVHGNVRFGLSRRQLPTDEIRAEVDRLMQQLGLTHLADRFPRNLSGGEKQRVALARALAIRPHVLLLDEPVSALDEQTRDRLCRLLKQLQRSTQTTTIHVCHNFAEMLAVADRVGIIHQGRIVQIGTPQEILQRPASTLVAQFVQAGNVFSARAQTEGDWVVLHCETGLQLRVPRADARMTTSEVTFMVRPENICLETVSPENSPPGTTILEGSVAEIVDLGPTADVTVICDRGTTLHVSMGKRQFRGSSLAAGGRVYLSIAPDDLHVMSE